MPSSEGRRILVVEDEAMVAMLIEDLLMELGHAVVGPMMTFEDALAAAETAEIGGAVVDMNLNGRSSIPIAEALRSRGIPLLFATGYAGTAIDPAFKGTAVLSKPFTEIEFRTAIERLTA